MNLEGRRDSPRWLPRDAEVCLDPESAHVGAKLLDLGVYGAAILPPVGPVSWDLDEEIGVAITRPGKRTGCRAHLLYKTSQRWGLVFESPIPDDFFAGMSPQIPGENDGK